MTNLERARKSIGVPKLSFVFPRKIPLEIRVGDILDKVVVAKYWLTEMWYDRIVPMNNPNLAFGLALSDGKVHQHYEVLHVNSISLCLAATDYKAPRKVFLAE